MICPADDAAGNLDAGTLHVELRGGRTEDKDAVTGLRQGGAAVDETRAETAVEGGRHAIVGHRNRAGDTAEVDLTRQGDAGACAPSAEGEVAFSDDGIRQGTSRADAIAEEHGASPHPQGTTPKRAGGNHPSRAQDGVRAQHDRAGGQDEIDVEGIRTAEGEDAVTGLGQRLHEGGLDDRGGDVKARRRDERAGFDQDRGELGGELQPGTGDDRDRQCRVIGGGHRCSGGQGQQGADRDRRVGHPA